MSRKHKKREDGLTEKQVRDFERLQGATAEANATGLPGPLLGAFASPRVKAAGLTLQPVVAYHITMMEGLRSVVWKKATMPAEKRDAIKVTHDDIYQLIYLFTRPIEECEEAFSKGAGEFRKAALRAVAFKLPPLVLPELEAAIVRNLELAFGTLVEHEPSKTGEDGTVFTTPPAGPKMGSVGG